MCLYPTLRKNKKYVANKKNGGIVPPVYDDRVLWVATGCGECIECRKQYARNWQIRLLEEIKENKNGKCVTLTFSNEAIEEYSKDYTALEGYNLDNKIATVAMRMFLERWRKKYKKSIRHWCVTELGQTNTERIHIHGIMWCDDVHEVERIWNSGKIKNGHVWKGAMINEVLCNYVNNKTVTYLTKYVSKIDKLHKTYKSLVLTSPGIGRNYINRKDSKKHEFKGSETIEYYKTDTGHKMALPTYYRNKVFTEEQRELLWINLLNKGIRYVCGEKIDISKDYKDYDNVIRHYREKNKKLGYGNGAKDQELIEYEKRRRSLLIKEKIIKTWEEEIMPPAG